MLPFIDESSSKIEVLFPIESYPGTGEEGDLESMRGSGKGRGKGRGRWSPLCVCVGKTL